MVEVAGAVVGFGLGVPLDGHVYILELSVRLEQQGRGMGRMLIREIEAWARDGGYGEVTLTTYRDVPWNAPFYARLGYELDERPRGPELAAIIAEEMESGFWRLPRVVMRKSLAQAGPGQQP